MAKAKPVNNSTPKTDSGGPRRAPRSAFQLFVKVVPFGAFAALAGVLFLVATATAPLLFGYHVFNVNGSSMEPSLRSGSAAVTQAVSPRALEVGDVIVREDSSHGTPVLHRIVEVTVEDGQKRFITQGDANASPDPLPVELDGPGDRVVYEVPYAGYILSFANTTTGRASLIGGPIAALAALWLYERVIRRKPSGIFANDQAPLNLVLTGIHSISRLITIEDALRKTPSVDAASIVDVKDGTAVLQVKMRAPVKTHDIASRLRAATGEGVVIEHERLDANVLRLRCTDQPRRTGAASLEMAA